MPPILAAFLTLGFIYYLFRRDFREKTSATRALWLPTLWMMIIGSRLPSRWLALAGFTWGGQSVEEGNPADAIIFCLLVLAGIRVLYHRRVALSDFLRYNPLLSLFVFYCFASILWSDFPLVAFKRWIKELGHPVMALILLTEPDPEESLIRMMKRCAYVLLPVSILFIKYFPELGRSTLEWAGDASYTGITTDKNALGCDCFILGLVFAWRWLTLWKTEKNVARRDELRLTFFFLLMILWLLRRAHSSTSIGSMALGIIVMLILGLRNLNKERIGTYALIVIAIGAMLEYTLGISALAIKILNRDPTLTGRIFVWREAIALQPNMLFGAGFESFWLGARLQKMWALHWWHPNEAHNGYIEVYLNLGLIGCLVLALVLLNAFWNARRTLLNHFTLGRIRLAFFTALLVYNWTEAAFKALQPAFFLFYIVAVEYPMAHSLAEEPSLEALPVDEDLEAASQEAKA